MNAASSLRVLHFIAADAGNDARGALGALCREECPPARDEGAGTGDRARASPDPGDAPVEAVRPGQVRHIPFCLGVTSSGRDRLPARGVSADAGAWWFRARRVVRSVVQRSSPAIVQAWSRAAAEACAAALAPRCWAGRALRDVLLVIDAELSPAEVRRVRGGGLTHRGVDAAMVCRSVAAMRRLRALGVPADRLFVVRDGLDERAPVVDLRGCEPAAPADGRAAARAALRIDPDDVAILALPPLERGAGFLAAWAVLLLERVLPRVRLIVPGGGAPVRRVEAVVRDCRQERILRVASPTCALRSLLASADVAIFADCDGGALHALLLAAAARVPIVAANAPAVCEVLSRGGVARLFTPGVPKDAARQLLRTIEAPDANATQVRAAAELVATATRGAQRAAYERMYGEIAARARPGRAPDVETL